MRAIAAVTTPGETAALCHSVGLARASFYRRRRPTPSLPPPPSRAPSPRALAADDDMLGGATMPESGWSWDITKLKGPIPYLSYSLYVILDLFSRYVVGWMVRPA